MVRPPSIALNPVVSSREWWRFAAGTVWIPSGAEMAEIDRRAVDRSIPERALIENAGRALAHRLHERWPAGQVIALAGSGHNGADALVALRTLHAWGRDVVAVRCGGEPPEPDVLADWDIELQSPESVDALLSGSSVAIDGILGTGLSSYPREPQARLIGRLNASRCAVVACDGPSGVNFSTGEVPGPAVRADLTVTFGWPKLGLLLFPAREMCGDIEVVEIGFPPATTEPRARLITAAWAAEILGRRGDGAHKGDAGYLSVVGGQSGMAGAVVLAARAALRGGAGVVRVISAPENREVIQATVPAAVFVSWDDEDAVDRALVSSRAITLGPGLGTDEGRRRLVSRCLEAARGTPCVVDADALNLRAGVPDGLRDLGASTVLTPHPGEMGRLLGRSVSEVTADPIEAATGLSRSTGATVLLKGAPTVVVSADGRVRVSSLISPAFAAGGMGDVLAGLIGAFLAGGLDGPDAGTAALMVSGIAVQSAEYPVGFSAEDLPDRLPGARAELDAAKLWRMAGLLAALPHATRSTE